MNLELIKEKVEKVLSKHKLSLYSLRLKNEYGLKNIIEVIYKEKITQEKQEKIHYEILDEIDGFMSDDSYFEFSSRGLEYLLENITEIKEHIGSYIFIKCDYYKGYADLLSVDSDNNLVIKIKEKTKEKELKIPYKEGLKIRTAVKV